MVLLPSIVMIEDLMKSSSWKKNKNNNDIVLAPEIATKSIDLKFEKRLPLGWDQYIDFEIGEVYYLNKKTGEKRADDPRRYMYYSGHDHDHDGEGKQKAKQTVSATAKLLVLVGCKACVAYMMLDNETSRSCPRCGNSLLLFDRSGSF